MASGGPGLEPLGVVYTSHGTSLRLKGCAQGFGQSLGSGSDGGNGPISFDQRRLRIKAVPGRAAGSSSNGCDSPHRA